MAKMVEISIAELVEDFAFYPRLDVSEQHVGEIADAYEAGIEIPCPLIDSVSKRIVDGFHRIRAWRRLHGDEAVMQVMEKEYTSETEMYCDACRLVPHARQLSTQDLTHAVYRARQLKIEPEQIASVLSISVERVKKLITDKVVSIEGTRRHTFLKRSVAHMKGRTVTVEQEAVIDRLVGDSQTKMLGDLCAMLRTGLFDTENPRVMDAAAELFDLLKELLKGKKIA